MERESIERRRDKDRGVESELKERAERKEGRKNRGGGKGWKDR